MGFAFCKIPFYNLCLFIGTFRLLTFNMIIDIVGFNYHPAIFFQSVLCSSHFAFPLMSLGFSNFYDFILFPSLFY